MSKENTSADFEIGDTVWYSIYGGVAAVVVAKTDRRVTVEYTHFETGLIVQRRVRPYRLRHR